MLIHNVVTWFHFKLNITMTMLFSYGYRWQRNQRLQKMQANWQQFQSPCHRGNMAQYASPNGAPPWLHAKPLDAAIWQVPAPYCLSGHHGRRSQMKPKNTNKTQLLPSFLMVDDTEKLNNFGTQNGPSTHIINARSCVEMWSTTIQAEELSYILSYQT